MSHVDVREAVLPRDRADVERLWLDYLRWGNDCLEAVHGFRLPVDEAVRRDLEDVGKFQPPHGRLLLAWQGETAVGIACVKRIGDETAEIKRMYVQPSQRRQGIGSWMLDLLIEAARAAGYRRIRLDSPDFMTAAHSLYRSRGFVDITPYPESEIPDEHRAHWLFMERQLD